MSLENHNVDEIPWESRNSIVMNKDFIDGDQANIVGKIFSILWSISWLNWSIIHEDNLNSINIYKFFSEKWFWYIPKEQELVNKEKQEEISERIKKEVKKDILRTIDDIWEILKFQKDAFKYLYEAQLILKEELKESIELFFWVRIKHIIQICKNRRNTHTCNINTVTGKPENITKQSIRFYSEHDLWDEDKLIIAYVLKNGMISKKEKEQIFCEIYKYREDTQKFIHEFLPKNTDLVEKYIQKIVGEL